jgi:hypothetical protein
VLKGEEPDSFKRDGRDTIKGRFCCTEIRRSCPSEIGNTSIVVFLSQSSFIRKNLAR